MDNKVDNTTEIDLYDLALMLFDHIHTIVLCFMIGAVVLNAFSYFGIHPKYESIAKMYIVSASNDSVVDLTDLNIGASLTSDYEELILSYPVIDQVIERLDLECETDDLAKMVSISNPQDTRVLQIKAVANDPQLACDIANTFMDVARAYLPDTMSTDQPNVAQVARVSDQKVSPSYMKFTMIGAMLGAILCCAYYIVLYLLDDTIRSQEDLERYFGVVPLTSIPESSIFAQADANDSANITELTKQSKKLIRRRHKK